MNEKFVYQVGNNKKVVIIGFNFFQSSGPFSDQNRSSRGFAAEKNLSNLPEFEKSGEIVWETKETVKQDCILCTVQQGL